MDVQDLKQLKNLLEKLEQLESIEKLQKEVEELQEYKRRYLAIVGIVNWKEETKKEELGKKVENVIQETQIIPQDFSIVYTEGRTYGEIIRSERKRRRMTIADIAKACDLAACTVWEIENDKPRNNNDSKKKLEEGLKIKIVDREEDASFLKVIDKQNRKPGEIIRQERLAKGLTLKGLSEISTIPLSTIYDVETGKHKNPKTRKALEKSLKIKIVGD